MEGKTPPKNPNIVKADRHPVGLFCFRCEHSIALGGAYIRVAGKRLCIGCANSSEVPGVLSV